MSTFIIVQLQHEAIHNWPDAPKPVYFLRSPHRHLFHIRFKIEVFHDDRELEFMMVRWALLSKIAAAYPDINIGSTSCEMLAKELCAWGARKYGSKRRISVEVSEDGENGAQVTSEP